MTPPFRGFGVSIDPGAIHPRDTAPPTCTGPTGGMSFGYYLGAATMTREETGPPVPELARRITLASCARHDPARAFVPVLQRMTAGHGLPAR